MFEVTSLQEFEKIIETKKIIVVDFWAEWCTPCKILLPHLKNFEEHYKGNVVVVKINVDKCDEELQEKFDITAIPSIFFFNKGKILSEQTIIGSNIGDIYANTNLIITQFNS